MAHRKLPLGVRYSDWRPILDRAAADFRNSVCLLAESVGGPQASRGHQPQPVGSIVVKRAVCLAVWHAATGTAAGLLRRFVRGIFIIDFPVVIERSRADRWNGVSLPTSTKPSIL